MADKSGGSGEEGKVVSSNVARVSPVAMVVATSPSPNGTFLMVNEQANVEVRVGYES